jgi:hypothetical protein
MSYQSLSAVVSRLMNDLLFVHDDTRLNRRMVQDKVLVARANILSKYLRQQMGKIPGQYYNRCCFEVQCEPVCPGAPINVIRGKIPALLGQLGKRALMYLGTVDGKTSFEWRDEPTTEMVSYAKFGCDSKNPYFVLVGQKAEVYDLPTVDTKMLMVIGVFEDPFACGCPEDDIFIPADHIDEVEQHVKMDLATFLIQRRLDKINNTNSDN